MIKKFISVILVLCLVLSSFPISVFALDEEMAVPEDSFTEPQKIWDGSIADSYAGGNGSSGNPFQIETPAQLARMSEQVKSGTDNGKFFKLNCDIYLNDVSDFAHWDSNAPLNSWRPIASSTTPFSGGFDGCGHTIYGIYISSNENYQGLFASVGQGQTTKNINVDKSYIKGNDCVGGIFGHSISHVENCSSNATVIGHNYVGGIIGKADAPYGLFDSQPLYIDNCHNIGNISGEKYVGGLLGVCDYGYFNRQCYNTGAVNGTDRVGGIAGKAMTANTCWNVGKITGVSYVGGILGEATFYGRTSSSITSSFNAGSICGTTFVGGLLGYSTVYSGFYPSNMSNCYNVGEIIGTGEHIGGIAGEGYLCIYTNVYNAGRCSLGSGTNVSPICKYGVRKEADNMFFLTGCCGENFNNTQSYVIEKTLDEMYSSEFVTQLNKGGSAWKQDTGDYNLGYPILNGIDYNTYAKFAITEKGDVSFAESTYYVDVGETVTISAVIPQALNMDVSDIIWTISNKTVATISQEALVRDSEIKATAVLTGLSSGNTQITLVLSDGREATCGVVVSRKVDFDVNIYRADKLLDDSLPYKSSMNSILELQTPCNIMVPLLQESGFDDSAKAWKSLTAFFDTVDKPSNLKELIVEKKDIYSAIILRMLEIDTSRDYGILDTFKSGVKEAKSWESEVKNILKTSYNIDVTTSKSFQSLTQREKEITQNYMKDFFKKKHPNITFLDDCFSHMGTFFDVVDDFSTYIERCATVVELSNMNESLKAVVRTMCDKCPETNMDLELALFDCKSIIDSSTNALLMRMYNDGWSIIGVEIAERLIDELWKDVKKACNVGFPVLDIFLAAYKSGKFVSENVFNADKFVEQYFKMLATIDVESLVKNAYTTLENQYLNSLSSENATAYLSSIDVMYTSRDEDCINAYDFVDELDSTLDSVYMS